jgi:hypothetical protein
MRVKHLFYALLAMVTFVACDKEVEPTPQPDPKPEPIIPLIEITDVVINDTTAAISFAATNTTEVKGIAVKAGESVEADTVLSNGIAAEGDTINIEGLEYSTEYDFYVAVRSEDGNTALSEKVTKKTGDANALSITDVIINDTTATIILTATNATEVKGIAVKAGENVEVEAVLSNGIAAEGDTINIEGLEYITEYDFYVAAMFENGETALSEKFTRSTDYEPMPAGDYTEVRTAYGYTYDGFFILYKEFADGGEYVTLWINSEGIQYIIPEGEYSIDNGALMGNSTANNEALVEANLKVTHLGDQYMFELYATTESGKIYSSRWIGRLWRGNLSSILNPGDELPKVTDNNLTTINMAYGYYHDTFMEVFFQFEGGYEVAFKLATNEPYKVIPEGEYKLNDTLLDTSYVGAGPYKFAFEEATIIVEYIGNDYSISIDVKDEANNTIKTNWIGQMEYTGLDICILNPNS